MCLPVSLFDIGKIDHRSGDDSAKPAKFAEFAMTKRNLCNLPTNPADYRVTKSITARALAPELGHQLDMR